MFLVAKMLRNILKHQGIQHIHLQNKRETKKKKVLKFGGFITEKQYYFFLHHLSQSTEKEGITISHTGIKLERHGLGLIFCYASLSPQSQ